MSGGRRLLVIAASALAFGLPRVVAAVEGPADSMPVPPDAPLSYYYLLLLGNDVENI